LLIIKKFPSIFFLSFVGVVVNVPNTTFNEHQSSLLAMITKAMLIKSKKGRSGFNEINSETNFEGLSNAKEFDSRKMETNIN